MPVRAWVIFFSIIGVLLVIFPGAYRVLLPFAIAAAIVLIAPSL